MTTPPALLIADHGTQDETRAEAFRDFVRELEARNPRVPVAGGFVGPHGPRLVDAVSGLVEQGVTRMATVPLSLIPAGRTEAGIPGAMAAARQRHPGIAYACGRALGPHEQVLEVLERRLDEVLGDGPRSPSDRATTTVLLVGRGSTDPSVNAEVPRAARLLWEGRGFAGVEAAFVSHAAPDVVSGLDRCALLGARRIAVLPYFLFEGALPERARLQAEGWALAHPEVEVVSAKVMGPAAELAELVTERYEEAAAELAARSRCEACGPDLGDAGLPHPHADADPDDRDATDRAGLHVG